MALANTDRLPGKQAAAVADAAINADFERNARRVDEVFGRGIWELRRDSVVDDPGSPGLVSNDQSLRWRISGLNRHHLPGVRTSFQIESAGILHLLINRR